MEPLLIAGISRLTLHHVERDYTAVTFRAVVRVLPVLDLAEDTATRAPDDPVGWHLQGAALLRRERSV